MNEFWHGTRLARLAGGRDPEPTACVIGSQSVKTAPTVPAATQGTDAAKKIVGRYLEPLSVCP
jgi:hypothetical protein